MFQEIRIKKKSLSEILPKNGNGRSIRNVYSTGRTTAEPIAPNLSRGESSHHRWPVIIGLLLVLVVIGWLGSRVFAKAVVQITPHTLMISVSTDVTAVKIPPDTGTALQFTVMTLPAQEESQTVTATETQTRSDRATGAIIVYNTTSVAQKLVASTRFESPTGKIYRIDKDVVVPAERTANGQAVPGSVEVMITADQPGESYNSGPTDFTIPGFKDDPRFEQFYARSKTPLAGGFVGEKKVVAANQLETISSELQKKLTAKLVEDARSQLPAELILYDQAAVVTFAPHQVMAAADQSAVTVVQPASLEAVVFNRERLAQQLVGAQLPPEFAAVPYQVINLDRLQFRLLAGVDPSSADEVTFRVEGEAEVLFAIDDRAVAAELQGLKKSQVEQALQAFPAIESASVRFRPPWIGRVPTSANRIEIEVKS